MPFGTLADPETQGEGSIDPLGLATLADHLADAVLPGMTARMWRPRFLTAIAVTATLVEPLGDRLAADGTTPPWLAFEWYFVEAMAGLRDEVDGALRRVPGIDKARRARRDGVPMSAGRYLKTPKVFGFHGVYKRLARALDIVDEDVHLGEFGYGLVGTWAREQEIPEFLDADRDDGAAKVRRLLGEAVEATLDSGETERPRDWQGAAFLVAYLVPSRIGRREAEFLWEAVLDPAAAPRGEVFRLIRPPEVRARLEEGGERALLQALRPKASPELAQRLDAIEAYEGVCRPLQEAWDHLRRLATLARPAVVDPAVAGRDARLEALARAIPEAIDRARPDLATSAIATDFDALMAPFARLRSGVDLVDALWGHHDEVQRRKPPEGKRPWFEVTREGGLIVRPPYRVDVDVPPREAYVHPYRLTAVVSFLDDLWGRA
jgi:hypothetical protein